MQFNSLTFRVEPPAQGRFLRGEEEQHGDDDHTCDGVRDVPEKRGHVHVHVNRLLVSLIFLEISNELNVSHPFLKNTDQPVTNFGSRVKRRTENRMKKKAMDP